MTRMIKSFAVTGRHGRDGDWDPASLSVEQDEANLDELYELSPNATLAEVAQAAVDVLEKLGCNHEYSSWPEWQPHGWYSAEPYQNPHTGKHEERSAHLKGFSEEESRLIHSEAFAWRRAS